MPAVPVLPDSVATSDAAALHAVAARAGHGAAADARGRTRRAPGLPARHHRRRDRRRCTATSCWSAASTPRPSPCSGRASSGCGPACSARRARRSAPAGRCARTTWPSRPTASTASPGAATSTRWRCSACSAARTSAAANPHDHNFNLYTIVIGAQTLHAAGYAMGVVRDGAVGTGDPERDTAVLAFFGDGASSQGDVNESFVWAAAEQPAGRLLLPEQPVGDQRRRSTTQSRVPLYQRASGFGFPGVRIDGNDVLASLAVTRKALDDARSAPGPDPDRGVHLPDEPAHHQRRPDAATGSAARPRPGSSRTRSRGSAPTSPGTPSVGADFFDDVERRGRDARPSTSAPAAGRCPTPTPDVGLRPRPRRPCPTTCASSATSSPPSSTRSRRRRS